MNKQVLSLTAALALGAATLCAGAAKAATPIPLLPIWDSEDQTIGVGGYFSPDWVATISGEVLVTDFAVPGDNYNIFDNGALVGTTNAADCTTLAPNGCTVGGPWYQSDPNVAWTQAQFAHASFFANQGDIIDIQVTTIPTGFTDSTVAITQVPEPATWAMMLIGLAGLGYVGYRRAGKAQAAA